MEPERVVDCNNQCGEGPMWHPEEGALYWNDIPNGELYRYDPDVDRAKQVYNGPIVGGLVVSADGALLLFGENASIRKYDPHTREIVEVVVDEVQEERGTRFNDVIADPEGRVFCGTMGTDERDGRLYRLDTDGSLERVLEGIGTPNGLGFSPDEESLYFTDSQASCIYRFDYDRATGTIDNRETVVQLPDGAGVPDGMTVDSEGQLWSAIWNGRCALRFGPDGERRERVDFPAERVTSVMFGGPQYRQLYATTAGGENREQEGDGAGALFRIEPETGGTEEYVARITT